MFEEQLVGKQVGYRLTKEGKQVGYRLIKFLKGGGFGFVYEAEDLNLERKVAIKLLKPEHVSNAKQLAAFKREAKIIANFDHPHILKVHYYDVYHYDEALDIPFIVMPFIEQGSLNKFHPPASVLDIATIISYVKQIASALQYAHDHKIVHRDVKPDNFLRGPQGVLLSDFGIAIAAHSVNSLSPQDGLGTLYYMAPEQFEHQAQIWSDQYSLAVVVYEWLCGKVPFNGETLYEFYQKHKKEAPPLFKQQDIDVPPAIEQVVRKGLAKDPDERFACVQEFATALEKASAALSSAQATIYPSAQPAQTPIIPTVPAWLTRIDAGGAASAAPLPTRQVTQPEQTLLPLKTQASSPIGHLPVSHAVRQQRDKAELYMLQRMRRLWIAGVLDHSLHREVTRVLAASHPSGAEGAGIISRNMILERPNGQRLPLSSDTPIIQVYEEAGGDLLIVGQSGVGKTTLLLELARALIKRAESDPTRPLPIVLSLVSWATKQLSIEAWLIEEIHIWYPRLYGYVEQWMKHDQLHPLFDGLDEIPDEKRAACVNALAVYWRDHPGIPMVICSRKAQTLTRVGNFPFKGIISVHPLSLTQVDHYLDNIGMSLQSLREVLRAETALQAIASYPLMLCLLILTYHQSKSARDLQMVSPENLPAYICSLYVRRTLHRTEVLGSSDPDPRSIQGLKWLADIMKQQNLSFFIWDQVKREWLQNKQQCTIYYNEVCQSMNEGTISLRRGRQEWLRDKQLRGLYRETRLRHIRERLVGCLIWTLSACLFVGLPTGLVFELPVGLRFGLAGVLRFSLFLGLIFVLLFVLVILCSRLIHEPNTLEKRRDRREIRREILNWSLWQSGYSPVRDFCDFLDDAVERHLLACQCETDEKIRRTI